MSKFNEVIAGVQTLGDSELEMVLDHVRAVQKARAAQVGMRLKPGDKVRLTRIRPKKLAGVVTTVKRLSSSGRHVYVDGAPLGPRYRSECKVSLECVRPVA